MRHYEEKILTFLNEATEPVDIEKIRKACGIGNWNTALNYCLMLLVEGKIKGTKTSKSWIFWTYREIHPQPFQEVVGSLEALEADENEVTLILSRTPPNMKLSFPKNSPEAETLIKTLKNTPKGTKIATLFTDNPQKPLIIKTFTATKVAVKRRWTLWWVRTRAVMLVMERWQLIA
jgi:hypothetical protein